MSWWRTKFFLGVLLLSLWGWSTLLVAATPQTMIFATGFDQDSRLFRRFQILYGEAFRRLGLSFKLVSLPKDEALIQVNSGAYDGDSSRVIDLEKEAAFANLIRVDVVASRSHQVAFALNRHLKIHNWEDLKAQNLTIAYPKGQVYSRTRVKRFKIPSHKVLTGESCEQLMDWLLTGRIDVYLDNLENCRILRRSKRYQSIQVAAVLDADITYPYLHKKHRELIPRLSQALNETLADPNFHAQLARLDEGWLRSSSIQDISIYTPYDVEPFVINRATQEGIIYDFQRHLNAFGDGIYHFNVQAVARIPAERLLKMQGKAIVPYVAPAWFEDEKETLFDWTQTLLEDENVLVSARKAPLDTLNRDQLQGKTVCASSGLRLEAQLEILIRDGVVKLTESPNISHCLLMVAHARADLYIAGRLLISYFLHESELADQLRISPYPVRKFSRRILVTPKGTELPSWLNEKIVNMSRSKSWQKVMKSYHVQRG
jgi:polar amino acid transport system substrate-binding protein